VPNPHWGVKSPRAHSSEIWMIAMMNQKEYYCSNCSHKVIVSRNPKFNTQSKKISYFYTTLHLSKDKKATTKCCVKGCKCENPKVLIIERKPPMPIKSSTNFYRAILPKSKSLSKSKRIKLSGSNLPVPASMGLRIFEQLIKKLYIPFRTE
jgi:hypothetical protein